jgi:uncharacterized protein (TIGR00730 family)
LGRIRNVCVYCGARRGERPEYAEAAKQFGRVIAQRGLGLVYGGGSVGMMGILADAVLAGGGDVIGVIPRMLFTREVAHEGVTELVDVGTMHERKAAMAERADAFVALPGGLGTLEELFEALTWTQIGIHAKPCGLLDVDGYWDHLLAFLDHTVAEGFVSSRNRDFLTVADDPDQLLDQLEARHGQPDLAVRWAQRRPS